MGRLQRRDLQLRRAARRARGARPSLPHPQRHRSDRPRLRGVGRRGVPPLQRPVGDRPLGPARRARWCWRAIRSACGRSSSAEHAAGCSSPARSRRSSRPIRRSRAASTRSASTQIVHVLERRCRRRRSSRASPSSSPARVRVYRDGRSPTARAWDPVVSREAAADGFRGSLDDAVDEVRDALERRHQPAHAARRRAGRQLSLRRPRQLARRGARPAREGRRSSTPSRCASRTPSTTRPEFQRLMVDAPRQRSPRGGGVARRHRARVPRRDRPHRAADPAHRAGAAVPALEAGARRRHQGRADRRRRRRDVRRLRPVPRGQGAALLGARARRRRGGRG